MICSAWSRLPVAALLGGLVLAGCARQPAFRATLPERLDTGGSTIAIIADLQQTNGLVRFLRHREQTSGEQQQLVADLKARIDELGALIIVGDLVYTARSGRDWRHLDTLVAPFADSMPVLAAMGNHDYPCYLIQMCRESRISRGMLERFPWMVPGQSYAVPNDDLLLIFLDSETGIEAQGEWLERELSAAAGDYRAALVFYHRPAFTNSIDWGSKPNLELQQFVVPKLEASPVPVVVFNGHIHGYEYLVRDGVRYVTTAGGGGPRGPLAGQRPFDQYTGPDCEVRDGGEVMRPFNYVLLSRDAAGLTLDVRGLCPGDAEVRSLDRIRVEL